MISIIKKWGNSQGIRLPLSILEMALFRPNEEVEIIAEDNKFIGMGIVCPITNTDKKYPFRVSLDKRTKTTGVILCDQMKAMDLSQRNAVFAEKAPADIICDVVDILYSFIEM